MINLCGIQKYTKNLSLKWCVKNFVEKNGRLWKKMENYTYLCHD